MTQNYKFEGWMGLDSSAGDGNMVWKEYEPKTWEETDIDIKITHSGICGSDHHTLRSGWRPTEYPCVVGHEIVGIAVRVGSHAKGDIMVGDIVGVGAQSDSCLGRDGACNACKDNRENYCPKRIFTYGMRHRNGDKTYGGYAKYHRCPSHFVIKIPKGLDSAVAAPMLCGGVTVYSPLKYYGAGPGKKVGVVGVGGLGHFAVLFAKALGADEVVGISRKADKRNDAISLGCDDYIATDDDECWEQKNVGRFDIIISTISSPKASSLSSYNKHAADHMQAPFQGYIGLLSGEGRMVQVGAPEEPISLSSSALTHNRKSLSGSLIGSPQEIRDMFQLALDKGVKPWIEIRPMEEANQAIVDLGAGKPRFRYVLVN